MFSLTRNNGTFYTFVSMLRFLVYTLGFILLYRFLVNFLFPLLKVTSAASKKMREMQDQMNQMNDQQQSANRQAPPRVKEGDYIDYEEIK